MADAYKNILNMQGLKSLAKAPYMPDFHLMVAHAEDLTPQPVVIFKDFMPAQTVAMLPDGMDYEDVQANLASGKLTIDDFFQNVYPLGDAITEI